jgi:hypothetical protein
MPYSLPVSLDADGKPLVNQSSGGVYSLDDILKPREPDVIPPEPKTPESWGGELMAGASRGWHELHQMGSGFGALGSSWLGAEGMRDWFLKGYNEQQQILDKEPATVKSFKDIYNEGDGPGTVLDKFIRYGLASTGEFLPLVAQSVVSAGIGAAVGTAVEPGGGTLAGGITGFMAKRAVQNLLKENAESFIGDTVAKELSEYTAGTLAEGALSDAAKKVLQTQGKAAVKQFGADAAVGMSNVGMMTGSLYGELAQDPDLSESDRKVAATAFGIAAAIPMTGVFHLIASKFNPGATAAMINSDAGKKVVAEQAGYLTRFITTGGKEFVKNFGEAAPAMFLQTAITLAGKNWANPDTRYDFLNYSPEQWQEMIDAGLKGGIGAAGLMTIPTTLKAMSAHPNPQVRSTIRDVLTRANDVKMDIPDITPEHEELSQVQDRIGELQSSIAKGELPPDQLQAAQGELAAHQERETALKQQLGFGEEPTTEGETAPLVNEKPAEEKTPAIPENGPVQVSTPADKAVSDLRALYAQRMPTGEGEKGKIEVTEQQVADKQAEVDTHIDTIAKGTEYGKHLKEAFTPDIVRMMAAENMHLMTDAGEKPIRYGATMDSFGNIKIFVPDAKFVEEDIAASGGDELVARSDYGRTVDTAIAHEIIHAADLTNLRDQWLNTPEDSRGKLTDFVNEEWRKRGQGMREAQPSLPKDLFKGYRARWMEQTGSLSDVQIGQELPRMAVELGRIGKTSEVTEGIAKAARDNSSVNAFFRDWIDTLKRLQDTIGKWLDPKTANPELLKAYDDINKTLDKYGALTPEEIAPKPEPLVNQSPEPAKVEVPVKPAPEPTNSMHQPIEDNLLPSQQVAVTPQGPNAYQQFRAALKEKGPSDAVRSYLDWKQSKDELPTTKAETRAAFEDYTNRAPNKPVPLDRFRSLVNERLRENKANEKSSITTEPAKKETFAGENTQGEPTGRDESLQRDTRGAGEYHSRLAQAVAEVRKTAAPGGLVAAIRAHVAEKYPLFSGHLDKIVNQLKADGINAKNPEISGRWTTPNPAIRGEEVAQNIKEYAYAVYLPLGFEETKQLIEDRGLVSVSADQEMPEDHYIIDTDPMAGEPHPLVDQNASIHLPVELTNKLAEAQKVKGIPETHPVVAFGSSDLSPEMLDAFDKHFGKDNWVVKSFSEDALRGQGIGFAKEMRAMEAKEPGFLSKVNAEHLMVQEAYDIGMDRPKDSFTISGQELRIHVMTDRDGNAHVLPFTTFWKLTPNESASLPLESRVPIMVESPDILAAHQTALDAIHSAPLSDRTGQLYGLDVIRTRSGEWGVVELNPTEYAKASGFFMENPLVHDSFVASLMGERPMHAELTNEVHQAMLADSTPELKQSSETPLVNQNTVVAEKTTFTNQEQAHLNRLERDAGKQFNNFFDPANLPEGRSRTQERGGAGEYDHFTPQAMEYKSQPKTEAMERAQHLISEEGGAIKVAEEMARNGILRPDFVERVAGADEAGAPVNAGINAVASNVLRQLDSMRTQASADPRYRKVRMYLENLFNTVEKQYREVLTPIGRFSSMTHDVDKVVNGATARKSYIEPILGHLEKVLGKRGARFVSDLTTELNGLMSDWADRVVRKPEVIATLQKLAAAVRTREFQKQARRTYVMTERRARNAVRTMAARAAEHIANDPNNPEWANEAAKRIVKEFSGLPVAHEKRNEAQVFNSAVHQVAKDYGRELGLVNTEKGNKVSLEDKFAAILKNPDLYNTFTQVLRRQMIDEYHPEPGTPFADKIAQFHGYMQERAWSQGMVETLVNKNLRELEGSFSQIAQKHFGVTEDYADKMRTAVEAEMKARGVDSPGLVDKLLQDVENDYSSRTEEARLNFFGSKAGVNTFLEKMQTSLAEKARENAKANSDLPERLSDWLSEDYGIPNTPEMPLADMLHDVMTRQYNGMLGDKREEIINAHIKRVTDGADDKVKTKVTQSVDKILQLANLGVMRNEEAYNALADKFGLPKYSPEIADQIEKLGDSIATAPNPRLADDGKQVLANLVASQKGVRPYDMFMSGLYTNMLSGPSTAGVHISSNMTSVMGHVVTSAIEHPQRIPQIMRALWRTAVGSGQVEMRETFWTGLRLYRTGDKFFIGENPLEMEDPVFKSNLSLVNEKGKYGWINEKARAASENAAGFTHKLYRGLKGQYIGRYLSAADAFFYKMAQEASFAAKTGWTETPEIRGSAMDEARRQMAEIGESPEDSRDAKRRQQVLANEIINRMRIQNPLGEVDPDLHEAWLSSHNEAMDATFKQEPKGLLGGASNFIEKWARGINGSDNPLGKMLIPFTRIAANVTNQMLEWTPYGLLRYGAGHLYGEDFRLKDENGKTIGRDPKIAIRAALGSIGLMGLYATFAQYHDDKDPWLAIYDDGSKNPERRRQMMDMGWRPKTIKIGKGYYSYITTPFAMTFSILGRMFDNARDGRQDENGIASSVVAMLQTTTHESFLSSLTDFMSAVDSPNPETKISRMMARMATTPFVPNLARQIDKWVDPSIQQAQGFTENFLREFPVVRHQLKPSMNIFGEPLKHDPAINLPGMERFLTMEKTDDPVLNFLSESSVTLPGFSKSSKLGDKVMTREQYYDYVQQAGPVMKREIEAELPTLNRMTKEQAQERVNELVRKVKLRVRDKMRSNLVN